MADKNDIKRLNYFTGQFLEALDFQDEQNYHMDMRRRLNRLLYSPGVVDIGFDVTKIGEKRIKVGAGLAIDKEGRELVIIVPTDKTEKDVSGFAANAIVYVALGYADPPLPEDKRTKGDISGFIRITERPEIRLLSALPSGNDVGIDIPIAKLQLDAVGNIQPTIDTSVRQLANLIIRGGKVGIGTAAPEAKLQLVDRNQDANWGVLVLGPKNQSNLRLGYDADYSWIQSHGGKPLAINPAGNNVGIGTADPKSTLSVAGGLAVGPTYAKTNAAPANGLLVEGNVGIGTHDPGNHKLKVQSGDTYLDGKLTVSGASSLNGAVTISEAVTLNKSLTVSAEGLLSFGSNQRQMINLWSTGCGIGVQLSTQYYRTYKNFAWYKGGGHDDKELEPGTKDGTKGTVQMVIKDGNVGIGTASPGSRLEVGGTLTASNDNETLVALKIAPTFQDSKKTGVKHYGLIVADGNVGIGTKDPKTRLQIGENIIHRDIFDFSGSTTLLVHAKDHNGGKDLAPTQSVLALVREGVTAQAYGNMVDFRLGRWEHPGATTLITSSRSQLDIYLTEDKFVPKHVMSLRANGNVGIGMPDPKAKLEVNGDLKVFGGEIIGKIKTSEEFEWSTSKAAPVKMWPSATSVAFLTYIAGAFNGWGERVEIVDKDGFWWLQGQVGSGALAARARCIGAPPK